MKSIREKMLRTQEIVLYYRQTKVALYIRKLELNLAQDALTGSYQQRASGESRPLQNSTPCYQTLKEELNAQLDRQKT